MFSSLVLFLFCCSRSCMMQYKLCNWLHLFQLKDSLRALGNLFDTWNHLQILRADDWMWTGPQHFESLPASVLGGVLCCIVLCCVQVSVWQMCLLELWRRQKSWVIILSSEINLTGAQILAILTPPPCFYNRPFPTWKCTLLFSCFMHSFFNASLSTSFAAVVNWFCSTVISSKVPSQESAPVQFVMGMQREEMMLNCFGII